MIDTYTSNASYIVRHDFARFSKLEQPRRTGRKEKPTTDERNRESLDRLRRAMADDDGRGSSGSYKSPIF